MNKIIRHRTALLILTVALATFVWALLHIVKVRHQRAQALASPGSSPRSTESEADLWTRGVELVKADRSGPSVDGGIKVPPELQHYSDRHWFLATQLAEVRKQNLHTCQDFVDLAAMIEQRELVEVPLATESYVLFGVGASADGSVFSRYENNQSIGIYDDKQLSAEYQRLALARSELQQQIANIEAQLHRLTKRERTKSTDLQKTRALQQQALASIDEEKDLLDRFYGQVESRERLFRDYQSLETLATNFAGRSYDLANPSDRQAMRTKMLRALRPEALKVLQKVASDYHKQFARPLPVSSLIRPDQYQHALRRVNRNAVLIETPPHSTGLAFDVDYRYMSSDEQNFLMNDLAQLKDEGRIEVLRERNANYHVFVFLDGTRPSDELIAAALEETEGSTKEADHAEDKSAAKGNTRRTEKSAPRKSGSRR